MVLDDELCAATGMEGILGVFEARKSREAPLAFLAFDVLQVEGREVMSEPRTDTHGNRGGSRLVGRPALAVGDRVCCYDVSLTACGLHVFRGALARHRTWCPPTQPRSFWRATASCRNSRGTLGAGGVADFPYRQFFPKDATIVQIDLRGEQLGRRTKVDHGFVGDTKTTLRALLPKLEQSTDEKHLRASLEHYQKARKGLDELATGEAGKKPIHPQYVVRVLNEIAAEDAVFSCDVGTPTVWAARYLTMNGRRRLLGSFNHGSMANALPQAIGAQVSHPGRQVVSLSGDGGLAMLMGDLLSLRQLQAPVKVVVFRNDALAFVELEMKAAGILDFATDLQNPDFAKIAEAAGLRGLTAETPEQVRPMITQALQHDGPALVDVHVSRQELSMPPTISLEQMTGFSLFMLKAVLSGRGDEIIDLAKVNLFR